MCGRFNIDVDNLLLNGFVDELKRKNREVKISTGEIYPTNIVPIYTNDGAHAGRWGFPSYKGSRVIINARAETVTVKPMFRDSFRLRRCLIPCSGYYEWDNSKTKKFITLNGGNIMYLCGFYKPIDGEDDFVVMTAEARGSVKEIHDRMPLITERNNAENWMADEDFALNYADIMNIKLNVSNAI